MKHELRWYQKEAIRAVLIALKEGKTPYIDLFCGLGKSLIMAVLTDKALKQGLRVLQLVPTQELCEQNFNEAVGYIDDKHKLGMVCASLNKHQGHKQAVVAMVNSFVNKRFKYGVFDVLIIDECDLVSPDPKSMYQKIIKTLREFNPNLKIIGLTGSPYRMGIGALENDSIKGKATFTDCVWSSTPHLSRLIKEGYLSEIVSISGDIQADLSKVRVNSSGEYDSELMAVKFDEIIDHAVPDFILKLAHYDIKTALIFASNLANARHIITRYKQETGLDNIRLVSGETEKSERRRTLEWLKHAPGQRLIVNVGVLTRGYNYTGLDCVIFLRATQSLSLYVQCVGRVIRSHDDKEFGYVIDYGTNIARLGAIDDIKPPEPKKKRSEMPKKTCTSIIDRRDGIVKEIKEVTHRRKFQEYCGYQNTLSAKKCDLCGAFFIPDESTEGKYSMRTHAEILKMKREEKQIKHEVKYVFFQAKISRSGHLMVDMNVVNNDNIIVHNHFLCLDHPGFAKQQAHRFIKQWMRDPSHFDELVQEGLTTESFIDLVNDDDILSRYFKNIKSILLEPRKDNAKYNDVIAWTFE